MLTVVEAVKSCCSCLVSGHLLPEARGLTADGPSDEIPLATAPGMYTFCPGMDTFIAIDTPPSSVNADQ